MELNQEFLATLDLMFGKRLQSANLEEIPQVRVQTENTPELINFLERHGILLATVELQGNTIIVRNLQRLRDYKPEVDGGNGPGAVENLTCDKMNPKYPTNVNHACTKPKGHTSSHFNSIIGTWVD